ncbi:DNA-binding response regulator, NarL/FixJ family, contains REC and HTH domains [Marivirga sericea]|uniref:DNA-binding response regulator, NarL/FixJ family, contains REC and HTH domains n=1 Tax=Marivirga sericea TaxID=1028 RepID=A0A1X7KEY8_9BACT|nr:response regulator transcription factor [Marivirga sericea]SMG39475.1 DNA-binding response regulator, NarL/FixJ family, contains REC and HTH domains [Marivirga sericea]
MLKILLADDHQLVRNGIKIFLESEEDFEVIGEAKNGNEAIKKNEELEPEVVLLDISMPEKNGLEAVPEILSAKNKPKIVMLSMYLDEQYINSCMEAGVHGYIHKGADKEELISGVKKVMDGVSFYSKEVRDVMVNNYITSLKKKKQQLTQPKINLTKRELEIVKLIMKGYTSNQIAEELFISNRTVDTHRANLMQKLEVKNSIELINKVTEENLLNN